MKAGSVGRKDGGETSSFRSFGDELDPPCTRMLPDMMLDAPRRP